MRGAVLVGCSGCVVLGVAPWLGVQALAIVAIGIVLLPGAADHPHGRRAAGRRGRGDGRRDRVDGGQPRRRWSWRLLVQILVHHPLAAFLAMGTVALLGLPLAARLTMPAGEPRRGAAASAVAG